MVRVRALAVAMSEESMKADAGIGCKKMKIDKANNNNKRDQFFLQLWLYIECVGVEAVLRNFIFIHNIHIHIRVHYTCIYPKIILGEFF